MSINIFYVVEVLWPFLLELLVINDYSDAIGVICRTLHNVLTRKQSGGDTEYQIDFRTQGLFSVLILNDNLFGLNHRIYVVTVTAE